MRSETLFKHDLRTRILIFLNSVTLETAGGKIRIWLNFSKGKILVPVCNLISAQLTLVRPIYINSLAETVIATDITILHSDVPEAAVYQSQKLTRVKWYQSTAN